MPGNTQDATLSHPTPPREIQTQRLVLQSARTGDGPELRRAIELSLAEFYPWLPFSAQLSDLATMERVSQLGETKFAEDEFYVWRVREPDGAMVGTVDLHNINRAIPSCEIGYWVRSDRTGRGYAKEFVRAAMDIARNLLHMRRIEARCDVRNEQSWRLAEALGFTLEGIARHDSRDAAGDLCSTRIYSWLPDTDQGT